MSADNLNICPWFLITPPCLPGANETYRHVIPRQWEHTLAGEGPKYMPEIKTRVSSFLKETLAGLATQHLLTAPVSCEILEIFLTWKKNLEYKT